MKTVLDCRNVARDMIGYDIPLTACDEVFVPGSRFGIYKTVIIGARHGTGGSDSRRLRGRGGCGREGTIHPKRRRDGSTDLSRIGCAEASGNVSEYCPIHGATSAHFFGDEMSVFVLLYRVKPTKSPTTKAVTTKVATEARIVQNFLLETTKFPEAPVACPCVLMTWGACLGLRGAWGSIGSTCPARVAILARSELCRWRL